MDYMIEAKELVKRYESFTAVDTISFSIKKGEVFGFLGPNGAGKTTTINMLTGMAGITGGRVFYRGKDLTKNIKAAQQVIGIVPDESNLYDEMSGYENLCFCGALYGMRKKTREERARELLGEFNLEEAAGRRFKAYSKGMKRKLTIAAALMHSPEILFLDEPTTGIDVASVRQIREMIKTLNRNGTTIFLTTHYIEEAERLCGRIAFIRGGKIIKTDTVANLLDETRDSNIVDVVFESLPEERGALIEKMGKKFPYIKCSYRGENTLRVISSERIDISPVVNFLSSEKLFIHEARLLRPSLEDVFVKMTGIGIEMMKKEKEKK